MFGTQNKAGGLFGQLSLTPAASGTSNASTGFSLGGNTQKPATLGTTLLFGSQPSATNNQANQATNVTNTLATASTTAPAPLVTKLLVLSAEKEPLSKLLKDLIQQASNLPKPQNADLGLINLTLGELQKQLQPQKTHDNFTKAHYLLARLGINAETIENELAAIDEIQKQGHQPKFGTRAAPVTGGTLLGPTAWKKDENILATIEQLLTTALRDFDAFISANILIDWKTRRKQLRQLIGLEAPSATDSTNTNEPVLLWNHRIPGNYPMLAPLHTSELPLLQAMLRAKFEKHAAIVYELNEARLLDRAYPFAARLGNLNKVENDLKAKQMTDAWNILSSFVNEHDAKRSQGGVFFDGYQGLATHAPQPKFVNQVIANSSKCLETEFWHYVEEVYVKETDKPKEYSGGTERDKVRYLINKVLPVTEPDALDKTLIVNGVPVWALIFYMMRAGLYQETLQLVTEHQGKFNKFDRNFPIYFRKFVESDTHSLPTEIYKKVHQEFAQQFQFVLNDIEAGNNTPGFDPFKYAVYKIVGKCDLGNRALPHALNLLIEDWLWFHLNLVNEGAPTDLALVFDNYTLANLQQTIVGFGPSKFLTLLNYPLYLKALMLAGLYELAVQYTYEHVNECDAVHLAIGLNYYGVLRVSGVTVGASDQLVGHHGHYTTINFSRLMGSFVRTFKISDPKVASQYLILAAMSCGGNNRDETSKCHEALRELILVLREFGMLLGQLNESTGAKTPGLLEIQRSLINLDDLKEFNHVITGVAANQCMEQGRTFDALYLYQLAEEYDTVVVIVNKLVAEILALTDLDKPVVKYGNYALGLNTDNAHDTPNNNIILFAQQARTVYRANPPILAKITQEHRNTNDTLSEIIHIRDLFVAKDWRAVLHEIEQLQIIPIGPRDDLAKIRQQLALVQSDAMDDQLKRVIPLLLVMTMTLILQLNYNALTKWNPDTDVTARLRVMAKNCMIYAGMVQYRMPRETYSQLVNLEALL